MNFDGNFLYIGKIDIADLKSDILEFTEDEWNRNTWRQRRFPTHKDTTTIPLIFDADFRHTQPTVHPAFEPLKPLIEPIFDRIRRHYNKSLKLRRLQDKHGPAYPIRTILARLRPGGLITPHMDRNFSLSHSHRIHIPIQTRAGVQFKIDGEEVPLKEGDIWEINNRHIHQVFNNSPLPRIHMIVDWAIPGERCCCGSKQNPQGRCSPDACKNTDFLAAPCNCLD